MDNNSLVIDQQVLQTYLSNSYLVQIPRFQFEIGLPSERLQEFLIDNNSFSWGFFSPYFGLSDAGSTLTSKQMAQKISAFSKRICAAGIIDSNGNWQCEQSLFVLDIDQAQAIGLGRQLQHKTIIAGHLGSVPKLLWL